MKILNIDALAKATRSITLGGVTHEIKEMTVENFIETTKQAEALEKEGGATFSDQIEATISMIKRSIPTIEEAQLRALSIEQLVMVSKFLRGELDGEEVAEEGDEAKK